MQLQLWVCAINVKAFGVREYIFFIQSSLDWLLYNRSDWYHLRDAFKKCCLLLNVLKYPTLGRFVGGGVRIWLFVYSKMVTGILVLYSWETFLPPPSPPHKKRKTNKKTTDLKGVAGSGGSSPSMYLRRILFFPLKG